MPDAPLAVKLMFLPEENQQAYPVDLRNQATSPISVWQRTLKDRQRQSLC